MKCSAKVLLALSLFPFWATYACNEDSSSVETSVESNYICETETTSTTTTSATTTSTTETTTTTSTTSTYTTSLTTKTTKLTTTESIITTAKPKTLVCLGAYKGTYYSGRTVPCKGGSGRTLNDCGVNITSDYKGSVASKYVYKHYGYKRNGEPTKVYLEVKEFPEMNGWYTVDDCNGNEKTVDFYFTHYDGCPFQYSGVVKVVMYI